MQPIKLVIKSTLDKAGFDATEQSVRQLRASTDGAAADFSKLGNVGGAVSSAISGDVEGVSRNVLGLTKSLKSVGGALGGLARAAGPIALVGTVVLGAVKAIQALGEKIRKAREEAEAARLEKQAEALHDLADAYKAATDNVERYARAQSTAAGNAVKLQAAASGLQQAQLTRQMNEELARTPVERQDEVRKRYSRYAEDLRDAQALKAIELEMAANEAEIARQEKLASQATKFANDQLDAKNRLISDTARHIAGKGDFTGTTDDALAKAAEDSAVREAVAAEKAAKANAENARNELMKLKAAQDVLKIKAAEVRQNNENARAAREIEDRAEIENRYQEAKAEALKKQAEMLAKLEQAEKDLERARREDGIRRQNEALQKGLQLLNDQIAAAKELLGIVNKANGGRGRVANLEAEEKARKEEEKALERQRRADERKVRAIENRSNGKLVQDVNGNYYLRGLDGKDITSTLRGKDAEFIRRLNEINRAEAAVANAAANQNAMQQAIAGNQAQLAPDAVENAENAAKEARKAAEAARDAVAAVENKHAEETVKQDAETLAYQSGLEDAVENAENAAKVLGRIEANFASDVTALRTSFAEYRENLESVLRDATSPANKAIGSLEDGLRTLNGNLTRLLTAQ